MVFWYGNRCTNSALPQAQLPKLWCPGNQVPPKKKKTSFSGWWFSTHLKNMLVKMGSSSPICRGENKKHLSCHHPVFVGRAPKKKKKQESLNKPKKTKTLPADGKIDERILGNHSSDMKSPILVNFRKHPWEVYSGPIPPSCSLFNRSSELFAVFQVGSKKIKTFTQGMPKDLGIWMVLSQIPTMVLFLTIFCPSFAHLEKLGKTNIHQRLITSLLGEVYHQRFIKSNRDSKNQSMNLKVPQNITQQIQECRKISLTNLEKHPKLQGITFLGGAKEINWWIISRNVSSYTKGHNFFLVTVCFHKKNDLVRDARIELA